MITREILEKAIGKRVLANGREGVLYNAYELTPETWYLVLDGSRYAVLKTGDTLQVLP